MTTTGEDASNMGIASKKRLVRVVPLRKEADIEASLWTAMPMYWRAFRAGYLRAAKVYKVRHPKMKAARKGL